jgi:hypothetical protein
LIAPAGTRRYPPNGGGLNGSNRSHSPASFTPRQTQIGAPISLGWTTGNCETSDFAARQHGWATDNFRMPKQLGMIR